MFQFNSFENDTTKQLRTGQFFVQCVYGVVRQCEIRRGYIVPEGVMKNNTKSMYHSKYILLYSNIESI